MNMKTRTRPVKRAEGAPSDTRERILDVAERLFARRGIDAVSVRDIIRKAGANLGAINYHFGTKRKLIIAVFDRRVSPVTKERLSALDELEKAAGDGALPVEGVLNPNVCVLL